VRHAAHDVRRDAPAAVLSTVSAARARLSPTLLAPMVQPPPLGHTPGGRLVFHVFAALAEFIRELIVEGTREGLDAARARGVRLGRPLALTAEHVRHAPRLDG
jgi:hypothetical protein